MESEKIIVQEITDTQDDIRVYSSKDLLQTHAHTTKEEEISESDIDNQQKHEIAVYIKGLNVVLNTKNKVRHILKDINFSAAFGETVAIMGLSGSGKTSLLRYIANIFSANLNYTGSKFIAGEFKYVAQEEHLHGFYTVDQYLDNYIGLTYGFKPSKQEKVEIKKKILTSMGLQATSKTKVGDNYFRGLSGGEKRRLSIGLEMISNPNILILDEPTSGLDSFSAEKVIMALKNLTLTGKKATIMTVHQPSSKIVNLFDKIVLLKDGELIFSGKPADLKEFFKLQNETQWKGYSTTDQAIELLSRADLVKLVKKDLNADEIPTIVKSNFKIKKKGVTLLEKFTFLTYRYFMNVRYNPMIFTTRLFMFAGYFICNGIVFLRAGEDNTQKGINHRLMVLFASSSFQTFLGISAVPAFISERAIVEKEVRNKLYHPILYQISTLIPSLFSFIIISLVSSVAVVYLVQINNMPMFFLISYLGNMIAEAVVILLSILTSHFIIATAILAFVFGMFVLLCGFLIIYTQIPKFYLGVYYSAFHSYQFRALILNEFQDVEYIESSLYRNGEELLKFYGANDTTVDNQIIILIMYWLIMQFLISVALIYRMRKLI